jgi:glycosyltransferase 2 family protein
MKILIKLIVSGGLLYLFSRGLDLDLMLANLARGDMLILGLALATYTVGMVIRSWKFTYAMRIFDIEVPLLKALRINYVSLPFNLLLPAGLGEDATKTVLVGQGEENMKTVVGAVVFDKGTNLVALLILCNIGMVILYLEAGIVPTLIPLLVLVMTVVGAFMVRALVARGGSSFLSKKFTSLYRILREVTGRRLAMTIKALGMAMVMHLVISITSYYALFKAFPGPSVSYFHFIALVPLVLFLQIIPVFIGGVGAREVGFIYVLGLVGVSQETAILVPISYYGIFFVNIIVGLLLFLYTPQVEGEHSPRHTMALVRQRIFRKEAQ